MGYSRFEITEIDVTLRRAALPQLLDEAQARGYSWDEDDFDSDEPWEPQAVSDIMDSFFPDYHEETATPEGDFVLDAEVTWYGGADFALDDFRAIVGRAASSGDHITVEDYDYSYPPDGTYIYDIVFNGEGGHVAKFLIEAGRPVREPSR
jgi:hypothetical protein